MFPGEGPRRRALRTLSPVTRGSSRPDAPPCRATAAPPLPPSRETSVERGRCFSPTSATDVRHEHPCHRPTAERADSHQGERCVDPADPSLRQAGTNDPRCARPPCGDPTPADPHLTARCQLRSFPCTLTVARSSSSRRRPRRSPVGGPRRRTVVGCGAAARATSDVSCHAHSRTTVGAIIRPRTPRTAAAAASSKATACDDPRRLPSAGAPWTRALARAHSQILVGSLSPCPSLGHEGAGFRGPFANLCSREG